MGVIFKELLIFLRQKTFIATVLLFSVCFIGLAVVEFFHSRSGFESDEVDLCIQTEKQSDNFSLNNASLVEDGCFLQADQRYYAVEILDEERPFMMSYRSEGRYSWNSHMQEILEPSFITVSREYGESDKPRTYPERMARLGLQGALPDAGLVLFVGSALIGLSYIKKSNNNRVSVPVIASILFALIVASVLVVSLLGVAATRGTFFGADSRFYWDIVFAMIRIAGVQAVFMIILLSFSVLLKSTSRAVLSLFGLFSLSLYLWEFLPWLSYIDFFRNADAINSLGEVTNGIVYIEYVPTKYYFELKFSVLVVIAWAVIALWLLARSKKPLRDL